MLTFKIDRYAQKKYCVNLTLYRVNKFFKKEEVKSYYESSIKKFNKDLS